MFCKQQIAIDRCDMMPLIQRIKEDYTFYSHCADELPMPWFSCNSSIRIASIGHLRPVLPFLFNKAESKAANTGACDL